LFPNGTFRSSSWLADEELPASYVKNHNLGFDIPYTVNGDEHYYRPDFIARLKVRPRPESKSNAEDDHLLNLIIEVSGERDAEKAAKVSTARDLWAPAPNNHGGFGRWAFLEISDPWDAKNTIRAALEVGDDRSD
jgi:type III restriction enzyme